MKLGPSGVRQALAAGVNDLGGTLMNESISRAAGSEWGQELPPEQMEALIRSAGRVPRQRTTTYGVRARRAGARIVRRRAACRAGQPAGARGGAAGAAAARATGCAGGSGSGRIDPPSCRRDRICSTGPEWARRPSVLHDAHCSACRSARLRLGSAARPSGRIVSDNGVRLVVPVGWQRVEAAADGAVIDPRTLLVVGTAGVGPRPSACQIAAYRVPPRGAVVVVVGWKSAASGGGRPTPGRTSLAALRSVTRPSFECFAGRGAVVQLTMGRRAFQVNVMVGDKASRRVVTDALAVGRSFDLSR